MYIYIPEEESDPIQLQTVVCLRVGAGNRTPDLRKSRQCSFQALFLSLSTISMDLQDGFNDTPLLCSVRTSVCTRDQPWSQLNALSSILPDPRLAVLHLIYPPELPHS